MIALVYILATVFKTHSIRLYFALFQFLPALMIPSSLMQDLGHSRSEGGGGGDRNWSGDEWSAAAAAHKGGNFDAG